MKKVVFVAVLLALFAMFAVADVQQWNESNVPGGFDTIAVFRIGGPGFNDPGITTSATSWSFDNINPYYVLGEGPTSSNIDFWTNLTAPVTNGDILDMFAFLGGVDGRQVDQARFVWNGSWGLANGPTPFDEHDRASVPEPGSVALLVTMLGALGLCWLRKRPARSQ